MKIKYPLQPRLSDKQAASLASKLVYSVDTISSCRLDEGTLEIEIDWLSEEARRHGEVLLERMMEEEKKARLISRRVTHTHEESLLHPHAFDDHEIDAVLNQNGAIKSDLAVDLLQAFDRLFGELAHGVQASRRQYPSMIAKEALNKCRYVQTFPQNVFLVSEFPHQREILEQVPERENYEELAVVKPYVLTPAVCFHGYEELSGQALAEPVILTARANCFRHEASWRLARHRLNEFSMREILFVGSADFVQETRTHIQQQVWTLFQELGLVGHIETASDPFYFPGDAKKAAHQLMADMKYELVVDLSEQNLSFSIASFNNMKHTLCESYQITDSNGQTLHSGCVAFGIDRWVYAFLTVFGTDAERWPAGLSKRLGLPEPAPTEIG